MLKSLKVCNLAVVESAEADFVSGLTVITGETGAGKSVLMGALDLVLGGRADPAAVREGAKEAEAEADFGDIVIRRTVTAQGKSRAWINDESVTLAELKEAARGRVDIHGPRANQRLLEESFQRETLDDCGGAAIRQAAKAYAGDYGVWSALKREAAELSQRGAEDLEYLRFQVEELSSAALAEDDETIAERQAAAAHAEEIVENANAITEALGGDRSASEIMIALQPKFREISRHLPAASEWSAKAEEITLEIQELSRTVADAASRLDLGDENLDELDARLAVISKLERKYLKGSAVGEGRVRALMRILEEKRALLAAIEHRERRLAELEEEIAAAEVAVRKTGKALTQVRKTAAERFAKGVTRSLKDLGFLQSRFTVAVEPLELPMEHGLDRIVYMFEPNPGEPSRPLAAIASSGEIARVMLAVKTMVAADSKSPSATLVFDEIDANIGGEVGKAVGEKLRTVARRHQIIAITHLPQSAAFGERHLVVSKSVSGGRTRTAIAAAEGETRVAEIARMLGGEKITSVVKKHAQELLELSR